MADTTENKVEWLIVVKVTATDDVADAVSKVKVTDGKIVAVNPAATVQLGAGSARISPSGQVVTRGAQVQGG